MTDKLLYDPEPQLLGVDGVLIDLDGVLFVGDEAIPGAAETVATLRNAGLKIRGVTNTTTKSAATLGSRLAAMGLPLTADEIVTAPRTAASYLRTLGNPKVRLVLSDDALTEFSEFEQVDSDPDVIVVGDIGPRWDYALMSSLFESVAHGAELVALHKGRYYQGSDGLILDIGAFVTGLEYATSTQATVIGKPAEQFFKLAVSDIDVEPARAVMIGDDIESDIGGAQRAGLCGVLVRTGKFRKQLVEKSMVEPDAVIDSIADLPTLLGIQTKS